MGKLADNSQTAEDMADLVKALKEIKVVISNEHVETILAKLGENQFASAMAILVKALKENNPDLKFTEEHVKTILAKIRRGKLSKSVKREQSRLKVY